MTCHFVHVQQRAQHQNYKTVWVPDLTCRFVHAKQRSLGPDIQVCMDPRPHMLFWAHITAFLAQEYKDYIGSSPHCGFCMQNSDFWSRITSFYGSQKWPVILCMCNSVLNIRITSLYGSQPSSVAFSCKTAVLDSNNKSLWGPDITCHFVHAIQRD